MVHAMKTKLLTPVFLSFSLLLLHACAAPAPGESLTIAGEEPVVLKVSWWGSPSRDQRTLAVMKMFTDLHPHITFAPEHYANTQGTGTVGKDYWPTLNAHAADGTLPDVMQHDY